MTYAIKIDGAWIALSLGQQVVIGENAVPYAALEGWTSDEQEAFGAFRVPEPDAPPAGKVEATRKLGGTTRPKWVVTYANAPPAPEPVPTYRTLMTPIRFKAQFSVQEQVAIKRARAYVGDDEAKAFARDALDILFGSLDDSRLTEVDVNDAAVVGGIDFVQSLGILTAERAAAIKLGAPTAP